MIVVEVGQGNKCGDIIAGFARQVGIYVPERFCISARTLDGPIDIAGTVVIGCEDECPVVVYVVKVFEVFTGGLGGEYGGPVDCRPSN